MAISKGKKKEKEKLEICPNHPKIFAMQFLTFLPQNVSIFFGKFSKKFISPCCHCLRLILWENGENLPPKTITVLCISFLFFSFHFILKLKKKTVNTTFGFRWGF
jgi:hypothetical protein